MDNKEKIDETTKLMVHNNENDKIPLRQDNSTGENNNHLSKGEETKILRSIPLYCLLIIVISVMGTMIFAIFYINYERNKIQILVGENEMTKPLIDDRNYRVIRLKNNLEVLMISDKTSSMCSASMSVGVGSLNDDEDILGLAHFTEHMIFLGSKSFPKPGDFEEYLSDYFGSTNAYTSSEKTVFYFDVENTGFPTALKIFASMFHEPLFDFNFMSKEINAVNSENDKNLNQDFWREFQLLKQLSNHNNPFHRFSTGNNVTLSSLDFKILNQRLNSFFNKFYLPSNMKLVVLSNQSLDTIQSEIIQLFSFVRLNNLAETNKNTTILTKEKVYTEDNLGKVVWFEKLSSLPSVDIFFILDEIISSFNCKPIDYINYLLGYHGNGSLTKFLIDKGFANKVEVELGDSYKTFSQYKISIQLTDKGLEQIITILEATFNYINLIRNQSISKEIYNEIQNITETQFNFLEKNENYGEYISSLADNMQNYPYKNIIYGDLFHSEFNETLIRKFLNMLTPENSLILIGSAKYPDEHLINLLFSDSKNKTEKWYKTQFIEAKMKTEFINNLRTNSKYTFKLRPKNEYITNERKIVHCSNDTKEICDIETINVIPELYLNETNFRVWHKKDVSFSVPKVYINLNIVSSFLRTGTKDYFYFSIYYNYIIKELETIISEIIETGNEIKINFDENGILVRMNMYADLVNIAIDKIFQIILNPRIDETGYNELYELVGEEIKSLAESQPYEKSKDYFKAIVKYNVTSYLNLINYLSQNESIKNYTEFNQNINNLVSSFSINSLFYGYLQQNSLSNAVNKIKSYLKTKNKMKLPNILTMIDYLHSHKVIDKPVIFRVKNDLSSEPNDVVYNFFQVGPRDYKTSLTFSILESIWGNMFYHELRTVEQLGYIVNAYKAIADNIIYLNFIVQGNKENPLEMNKEIDIVLLKLKDKLNDLDHGKFKEIVESILTELHKKDINLKERNERVWEEIFNNGLDFNRTQTLINELQYINKNDVLEAFDNIFINHPRKLSIQIYAPKEEMDKETEEVYELNTHMTYQVTSDVNIFTNRSQDKNEDDN